MADKRSTQARVLVMDSNLSRARDLSHRLQFLNYEPVIADDPDAIASLASSPAVAVVLGDTCAEGMLDSFCDIAGRTPDLPVLLMHGGSEHRELQSQLINRPHWILNLPLRRAQLTRLLNRAQRCDGRDRRQRLSGNSVPIRAVRQLIEQVAEFDTNVLISGESGTGKELVARTIHELSDRADKPFVPINCGAIPAELLESELFGHDKGAFTGAVSARTGRFELAEGGTLFLDEIGDMSLDMQVKLLRVLQERSYERVGSNTTRRADVRIVAATHRNLPEAVASGEFREDLYYRLSVFPITMPPLYKRATDLPQLLDELLIQHRGDASGNLRVSTDALAALAAYAWPGNIRELSNLVERLAILHPSGEIGLDDLPAKYRDPENRCPETAAVCNAPAQVPVAGVSLKKHLQAVESGLIGKAMTEAHGVVAVAARLLKMQRTTLVEKLNKYKLNQQTTS